jgi:ribosomal protein S18 acetylase RimI-like enzyme
MDPPMRPITLRPAAAADSQRLQDIRARAFATVFASFRSLLGDFVYDHAQRPQDEAQEELLLKLIQGREGWELWVAEIRDSGPVESDPIVGFVAIGIDRQTGIGEIGLNAVDPAHQARGIGSSLYRFAFDRMREAGLRVATVSTGGDASHEPARRAYRKAGFDREIPSTWMCRSLER